jgi:hypothetical protein
MCSGALAPQLLQLNQCNRNTLSIFHGVGQYQPFLSTLWPISAFDHGTKRQIHSLACITRHMTVSGPQAPEADRPH